MASGGVSGPFSRAYIQAAGSGQYGIEQDEFERLSAQHVTYAAERFKAGVPDSYSDLFQQVIRDLWAKRSEMAKNSREAAHFGTPRSEARAKALVDPVNSTFMVNAYDRFRGVVAKQVGPFLDALKPDLQKKEFTRKQAEREGVVAGYQFKESIEVYEGRGLMEGLICSSIEDVVGALQAGGVPTAGKEQGQLISELESSPHDRDFLERFKRTNPKLYQRMCLSGVIEDFCTQHGVADGRGQPQFQNLKTGFAVVTRRLALQGNRYLAISRVLTPTYFGNLNNRPASPREWMVQFKPHARIIHQDQFLIAETLEGMGKLFAKAMQAKDLPKLKQKVALLRWTYANCMPCLRGDGAVGDWLELAIYQAKGYDARFKPDRMPSCEPLARSVDVYLRIYDETIEVTPKKAAAED